MKTAGHINSSTGVQISQSLFNIVLQEILKTMDVPENRKNDLAWLQRNLFIRNSKHPEFEKAVRLIEAGMKNEREN